MNIFNKKQKIIKITWNDITIGQYNKLVKVLDEKFEEEIYRTIKIMSIVSGKTEEFFYNLPTTELWRLTPAYTDFIAGEIKPQLDYGNYRIGSRRYRIEFNVEKMSTAQYIDFTAAHGKNPDNLANVLSRLMVPVKGSYNDGSYSLTELEKQIENEFKIVSALGIAFFFISRYQALLKAIQTYSKKKSRKTQMKTPKNPNKERGLMKNGVGSSPLNR